MAAASALRQAEARLAELRTLGGERNEFVGGWGGGHLHTSSHAQTEALEREQKQLIVEVGRLRDAVNKEKREIKKIAAAANDVGAWTSRLIDGDKHFATGEDGLDAALVARTKGLVSREDWARERDNLEKETAESAERAAQAEAASKELKAAQKKRQRKAQQSRLSFAEEEDGEGEGDAEKAADCGASVRASASAGPATAKQKLGNAAGPSAEGRALAGAASTPTAATCADEAAA